MPIYEYRCDDCGQDHEAIQSISDEALTECPACGQPRLRRLVSAVGFRLKGGGWYETDFKSGKRRNVAEGGGEGGGSGEGSGGGEASGSSGGGSGGGQGGSSGSSDASSGGRTKGGSSGSGSQATSSSG